MCYIKWGNSSSYAHSQSKTFFDIIIVTFRASERGLLKLYRGIANGINMARTLPDTFLPSVCKIKNLFSVAETSFYSEL